NASAVRARSIPFSGSVKNATRSCTKSASSWKITPSTRCRKPTGGFSTARNSARAGSAAKSCPRRRHSSLDRFRILDWSLWGLFERSVAVERLERFERLNIQLLRAIVFMPRAGGGPAAREQSIDGGDLLSGQSDLRCGGIFFEVANLPGARNRHEILALAEDPRQRQLGERDSFRSGDLFQRGEQPGVAFEIGGMKTRRFAPAVFLAEIVWG